MTLRGLSRGARLLVTASFLAAGLCIPSWALDVADGRIKLTLHEGTGRFSLAWQTGGASGRFVPLLASEDPRTSMLSIVVGNRVYTMGESPEFSETVEKTATGARFVWKSAFLQVTEGFTFISALGSKSARGVRIDLALKNLSNQEQSVGVRYLFDTYLGEASFVHFRTDALTQVTHELALTAGDKAPWWVSPLSGDPDELGFQVMLSGDGITVPSRVVFANWKRLTDSSWTYEPSTVRNFSLLPYSVNDSAASQYYDPRPLAKGAELDITLALGTYSKAGFNVGATLPLASSPDSPRTGAGEGAQQPTVLADLESVDAILAEIDAALASGTPLSPQRLAEIQATLKELSSRGAGASAGSGK